MTDIEPLYSNTQTAVLELISYPSALLSTVGSLMIVRSILYNHKKTLQSAYHRLMLGISVLDLLASLAVLVLGVWAVPEEVNFTRFGRGTFRTCAVSGFFQNFMFGTMWYSVFLSLYFLLLVRFEVKESRIARTLEPVAHVFSSSFTLVIGSFAVANEMFNPLADLPGLCYLQSYPPYCEESENSPPCERVQTFGGDAVIPGIIIVNVVILLLAICGAMLLILLKVCKTERQLRQYAMDGSSRFELSRTKETAWQGILYIGSFFALYIPIVVFIGVAGNRRKRPTTPQGTLFALALIVKITSPLQGFFDAYIYLRKSFWKQTNEGECFFFLRALPLVGGWINRHAAKPGHAAKAEAPRTAAAPESSTPAEDPWYDEDHPDRLKRETIGRM